MTSHSYLSRGLAILLCICGGDAGALVTYHGREPLGVSAWSAGLTEIVNDKARFSGRIGPLAPAAEFQYSGGTEALQRVLEKFVRIPGQTPHLYLHPGSGTPSAKPRTTEEFDFALIITATGEGSLHVYVGGIPLQSMKIPPNVVVAEWPEFVLLPGPEGEGDREDARRIAAFVKEHEARRKSAR